MPLFENNQLRSSSPRALLILGCSSRKRHDLLPLPALGRYDGVNYRVLARALRSSIKGQRRHAGHAATLPGSPSLCNVLDILIVSAEFGLLTPATLIADYDRRMTPARALELQRAVSADLDTRLAAVPYSEIFVNLGKTYLVAVEGSRRLRAHPQVIYASGGIGQKMAQMKRWLNALDD